VPQTEKKLHADLSNAQRSVAVPQPDNHRSSIMALDLDTGAIKSGQVPEFDTAFNQSLHPRL